MFLIIILVVIVGIANFFYLLPPVVNWDEGTHALWGFKEWLALRSGDWHLFWQLSRDQFSYPPLGSWLIALTNLPAEFSMNLARFTSTLGFIVGGILMYLIAEILYSPRKIIHLISQYPNILISLFLFLTSPAILFYSVTVFKESWGMALSLLTIYLYFRAVNSKKIISYLLAGLALTLLFFEKYNYAVLLGLVLGLEAIVEGILIVLKPPSTNSKPEAPNTKQILNYNSQNSKRFENLNLGHLILFRVSIFDIRIFILNQLALFLPIIIFASWWVLTPDNKLSQFLDIMRSDWNPVTVGVGNGWQYLTFFAQSIRVSYTFSDVLFLLLVVGFMLSLKDLWQKKIRVLWLFFTINFVLGTMHSINLQDRYILTSVPALFLLVGYEFSSLAGRARRLSPANAIFVLVVVLVLIDLRNFPQLLKSNATHMLLSPMYNETDYHDTFFNFNKNDWSRQSKPQIETPEAVIDYILNNVDIAKPINYLGWTAEISPDWVELRRQIALRNNQSNKNNKGNYLVTIEVKPTSRLYTYDYKRANLWQLVNIAEFSKNNKDKLIKQKDFKQLGVKVRIYKL